MVQFVEVLFAGETRAVGTVLAVTLGCLAGLMRWMGAEDRRYRKQVEERRARHRREREGK